MPIINYYWAILSEENLKCLLTFTLVRISHDYLNQLQLATCIRIEGSHNKAWMTESQTLCPWLCDWISLNLYSNISVLFRILVTLYKKTWKSRFSKSLNFGESIKIQNLVHHFFTLRTPRLLIFAYSRDRAEDWFFQGFTNELNIYFRFCYSKLILIIFRAGIGQG